MKDLTGKLGELIFPDVEEKKSRRIVIQVIIGLSIAMLSMAGMLFYSHQEVGQRQKFQQIKGAGITLPEILPDMPPDVEGGKEAEPAGEKSPEGENSTEDMGEAVDNCRDGKKRNIHQQILQSDRSTQKKELSDICAPGADVLFMKGKRQRPSADNDNGQRHAGSLGKHGSGSCAGRPHMESCNQSQITDDI